jgi:hypothetical protein
MKMRLNLTAFKGKIRESSKIWATIDIVPQVQRGTDVLHRQCGIFRRQKLE